MVTDLKKEQYKGPNDGWALGVGGGSERCLEKVPLERCHLSSDLHAVVKGSWLVSGTSALG